MGVMIALTVALSAMLGCARSSQPMDNLSLSSSTRVQIPDAGACWTCSLPLQHELHQRRHHHEATTHQEQQQQQQQRRHEHQDRQHYDHHQQQQSTRQRGELASILTEAVKQHILARLQLRAPPNVSTRAPVPRRAVLSALRRLHHHGGSRPLTGAPAHGVHQTWAGHARRRAGYARDDDASTSGSSDKGGPAAAADDDDDDDYYDDDDYDEDEDYDDGGGGRAKYGHSSRRGERRQRGEMSEIVSFAEPDRGWSGELRFHVLGEGGRRLHVNQASLWLYLRMEGARGTAGGAAGGGVRGGGRAKGGPRGGANVEAGGRGEGGGDLDSSSASAAVAAGEDKTKSSDVTGGVDSRSGGGGADGGGTARSNPRHKWHHQQQQQHERQHKQQHKQQRQRLKARSRQRAALVTVRIQVSGAAPSSPSFSKRLMLRRASWRAVPLEAAAVRAALERAGGRVSLRVSCPTAGPREWRWGRAASLRGRRRRRRASIRARTAHSCCCAHATAERRAPGEGSDGEGLECDGVAAPLCCRRHFYVDFGAIGWADWIIAPAGYFANYCEGKCPAFMSGALGTAASFHSAVLSQYRLRDTTAPGAGSCCIPTRLSAMSMLYFDEDQNIVKKDVPNMIVEECGCV
ncbi:LOW QUALITY PROTEIN: uncharacterized protein LOC133344472 [Lethenteron reissneri]|uniref:LOW QUALITY PROTEIN: uncharacterized protein LOC133344472 n=1 Tax=Lethenteron reissneri TaxID=7753 RepID=UPI002AB71F4C|nr:LOW QUALITY PROTEIN: uncharacterized protein LOC133344472 [Lethenteron reissneri]